jgi:hypothetical protein
VGTLAINYLIWNLHLLIALAEFRVLEIDISPEFILQGLVLGMD